MEQSVGAVLIRILDRAIQRDAALELLRRIREPP